MLRCTLECNMGFRLKIHGFCNHICNVRHLKFLTSIQSLNLKVQIISEIYIWYVVNL